MHELSTPLTQKKGGNLQYYATAELNELRGSSNYLTEISDQNPYARTTDLRDGKTKADSRDEG